MDKIFIEYWSQITLILLAVGYFVKRIFDLKSKKVEINHNLFQHHRLKIVNEFYSNYAKTELMWNQLAIFEILSRRFDPKAVDKMIFPILNELNKNLLEIRIYFKETEVEHFEKLVNGMMSINKKLSDLYFDHDKSESNKNNEFFFYKAEIFEQNIMIIKILSQIIRETYKS